MLVDRLYRAASCDDCRRESGPLVPAQEPFWSTLTRHQLIQAGWSVEGTHHYCPPCTERRNRT